MPVYAVAAAPGSRSAGDEVLRFCSVVSVRAGSVPAPCSGTDPAARTHGSRNRALTLGRQRSDQLRGDRGWLDADAAAVFASSVWVLQ